VTSCWSASRPTPARATPSPRPAAGGRWWSSTGRSRSSDPAARSRSWTWSRAATRAWSPSTCGTTRAAPGQCQGCTTTAWHLKDAVYLNARGVLFAILTTGRWTRWPPTSSSWLHPALGLGARRGRAGRRQHGSITGFLRDGDRVFLTYATTDRAGLRVLGPARHDALRPPRGVGGHPQGWPEALRPTRRSVGMARRSAGTGARTPTASPPGPDQPPRAAVDPPRRDRVESLGRRGRHH
jgi:Bacterial protein of unknown function (DUF899)